ncbi:MAG: peptidylprolyl isomerase [Candidatus Nitrosopumilus limneticus]|nr:Peptidylprolyl isomerase [Candidatus Nitrosopumilus limneticus]MDC4211793.1 peptidylprolyl isomerase [Candidatus Nitrosopumilus limneticus]MDC4213257.1 peptidylprolyl isomerase [Candidatus Nitrosopumilus limneticus]MDC4216347.1 peptidylprolyl isomerase [Candidatus Nitrosopumilus limneticus]MDC4218638.1 peptidylprolyl isomerase [Candidatus Nitrosopumilus limneticus]
MKVVIITLIAVIIIIGSSANIFGTVLVFLDKDVYEIPTPEKPLTIFIDSPGKVTISVSNGEIATVLGETTSGEFTIYHDDYNFIEGTMLIANHINDYTLKEWTDVSTFSKNASTEFAKEITNVKSGNGGGCLIATATYGSELAPQVQLLREIRDNQLLNTESGSAFMQTFNDIYYTFSPTIADYERENPYLKEAVKIAITPMISTLSLMENANSESEVLGIGISVIALNLGMYIGIPAIVLISIKKKF